MWALSRRYAYHLGVQPGVEELQYKYEVPTMLIARRYHTSTSVAANSPTRVPGKSYSIGLTAANTLQRGFVHK